MPSPVRMLQLMWSLLCCMEFVLVAANDEAAPTLRLLSYNIHHAEGTDGVLDVARIARIITESGADVAALQEMDKQTRRTLGVDQAARLAALLGWHHVFGKALHFQGGMYGLAVLSRWPIQAHRVYALPYRVGQEPRIALEALVLPDNGLPRLRLFNTHLCHLSEATRQEQVQRLLQVIPRKDALPILLAGDFNARPGSMPMEPFWAGGWKDLLGKHQGIDYLLAPEDSPFEVRSARIMHFPLASDPMPVLAELRYMDGS